MSDNPIEDIIYNTLIGIPAIKALVDTRIFPGVAPKGTLDPWITYSTVSGTSENSHSGNDELDRPRIQLSMWSADTVVRKNLKKVVKDNLDGEDLPYLTDTALWLYDNDRDSLDEGPPIYFGNFMDFLIWF